MSTCIFKELKTKRLEIEALKILKVKKEDKLEEVRKFNSNIVADYDNINIPDRWIKLIQDQNIQTHLGQVLRRFSKIIFTVFVKIGRF